MKRRRFQRNLYNNSRSRGRPFSPRPSVLRKGTLRANSEQVIKLVKVESEEAVEDGTAAESTVSPFATPNTKRIRLLKYRRPLNTSDTNKNAINLISNNTVISATHPNQLNLVDKKYSITDVRQGKSLANSVETQNTTAPIKRVRKVLRKVIKPLNQTRTAKNLDRENLFDITTRIVHNNNENDNENFERTRENIALINKKLTPRGFIKQFDETANEESDIIENTTINSDNENPTFFEKQENLTTTVRTHVQRKKLIARRLLKTLPSTTTTTSTPVTTTTTPKTTTPTTVTTNIMNNENVTNEDNNDNNNEEEEEEYEEYDEDENENENEDVDVDENENDNVDADADEAEVEVEDDEPIIEQITEATTTTTTTKTPKINNTLSNLRKSIEKNRNNEKDLPKNRYTFRSKENQNLTRTTLKAFSPNNRAKYRPDTTERVKSNVFNRNPTTSTQKSVTHKEATPNKSSLFVPKLTRNYERKYPHSSTTEDPDNTEDKSLIEDLNIEALNARNKKIFDNKKHTSLKPKLQTPQQQQQQSQEAQTTTTPHNSTNEYNDDMLDNYDTTTTSTTTTTTTTPYLTTIDTIGTTQLIVDEAIDNDIFSQSNAQPTTLQTPTTTLLHIFTLLNGMSTSENPLENKNINRAQPILLSEEPKHKVLEVNRIVEITSKEDKLRRKANEAELRPVGTSKLRVLSLPYLEQLGEISVVKYVHLVNGSDIEINGHSTVADYTPTEPTVPRRVNPVRNSLPAYIEYAQPDYAHIYTTDTSRAYSALTERYGKALIPEVIREAVETSTISLEGLFENTRKGKLLNNEEEDDETTTITPIQKVVSSSNTDLLETNTLSSVAESTTKATTVASALFPTYVRPIVPLLRPESNETSPIVISIANLDKVILSKVNKEN